jgi:PAS domain S-box-containing protein
MPVEDGADLTLKEAVEARNRTSARLRQSEQNFRTIIERSPLPTCVSRIDRLVYANPAMLAYLGYGGGGEMLGPTLADLSDQVIHPDDRARTRDAFRRLFAGLAGSPASMSEEPVRIDDVRLRRKSDGALLFCDMHGVVVLHDGSPALVTYLHDHTERRIGMERIRLTERMASLGTLAAGVAHEINNPLTYVMSNVDLVVRQLGRVGGDPATARLLADVHTGLERIRQIVGALKRVSRPDADTVEPVDVIHALESCMEMARGHIRHRGKLLRAYADVPPVLGNETRLGQVFLNLLVNAAESLDEAKRDRNEIAVKVEASGDKVTVEVRDTGAGIAAADLPHIFDPFFTTKAAGAGTGLGLFVCHGIVTSLGGGVAVESAVGLGTTVRVVLPVASRKPLASAAVVPGVPEATRVRLLVVDDEPRLLETLRVVLADVHDVTAIPSARDALARLLAGERFDLVLCDLTMPEMSGAELLTKLEASCPEMARRVVFMTGGAVTDDDAAFLESLTKDHLQKPFRPPDLVAFIRRQLDAATGRLAWL